MSARWQMCTADELIPGDPPCQRLAQWEWRPDPDDHPVFLCNFHAEPLTAEMSARGRSKAVRVADDLFQTAFGWRPGGTS